MMKVIGPDRIAPVSALIARKKQIPLVSWILADHKRAKRLNSFGDFLNQMLGRVVRDGVSRVKPEAVNVEFLHPVKRDFPRSDFGQVPRRVRPN